MSSAVSIILVIGVIAGAAYLYINRCTIDFMKSFCEAGKAKPKPAVSTGANIVAKNVTGGQRKPAPTGSAVGGGAKLPTAWYSSMTNTGRIAI